MAGINCWCKKVINYSCCDCEKTKKWNNISPSERLDLLVYAKQLRLNRVDLKFAERILNKNLCVSMIPKNANI